MLACNKCDYITTSNLKFAVINNVCPACGYSLLGDSELQAVKGIGQKLKGRECSVDMSDYVVYDLSLFIYNEFVKKNNNDDFNEHFDDLNSAEADKDEISSNSENYIEDSVSYEEDDAEERLANMDYLETNDNLFDDELSDADHKVARLKRLAKSAKVSGKTGAKVRRASDS